MLAAGLTIITTTLTNRESIRQQFAKDANIIRKERIYGPLFTELKQLDEWLDEAKKKEGPYPDNIHGASGEPKNTQRDLICPTFLEWPQFKQDYRTDSFKLGTRILLDEAQRLVVDYNHAMEAAVEPAVNVLAPHIEKAISAWMEGESFKDWDKRSSGGQVLQSDPFQQWNSYVKNLSDTIGKSTILAKTWLVANVGLPYRGLGGLGWLVAGAVDKAAMHIMNSYHTQMGIPVCPDISWFQGIIDEAWPELDNLQEIKKACMVAEALQTKVREVENLLESGIRFIRYQFEGGEPPI